MKKLTVLSFGGGQDSTAILLKILYVKKFRKQYAPGDLVVVMSDTGDEHDYTLSHVNRIKILCSAHGVPFFHLTSDMGFHVPSWPNLMTPQQRAAGGEFKPTMVQLGTKTCTLQLKIGPIYKWLDEYINETYGYGFKIQKGHGCLKQAINRFGKENGKIRVLIGFAAGEERRMEKSLKQQAKDYAAANSFWQHIERSFPLIDHGMDRSACQKYLSEFGLNVMPSNCMRCPYMSSEELLWLHLNAPKKFEEWCQIEEAKIQRFIGEEKNHGVFNTKKLLRERLAEVKAKYAHMSRETLKAFLAEHKMNHGCGSSAY